MEPVADTVKQLADLWETAQVLNRISVADFRSDRRFGPASAFSYSNGAKEPLAISRRQNMASETKRNRRGPEFGGAG